jgi:hypothetical protein
MLTHHEAHVQAGIGEMWPEEDIISPFDDDLLALTYTFIASPKGIPARHLPS